MVKRKVWAYLFAVVMALALLPSGVALAVGEPALSLGGVTVNNGVYSYPNAAVSGSGIRTLLVSFISSVASGDQITLPSPTPSGFTVSDSSLANAYAKRINLDAGTSAGSVQAYLRGIGFTVAGDTQQIGVTVTSDVITSDTYYYEGTKHYYQYVPYASGTTGTWTDAYTAAKNMSYMGRTGYMATITSADEDRAVNELSSNKTGWLGGTYMTHSATGDALYYDSFTPNTSVSGGWYWACGPEKGTEFYSYKNIGIAAGTTNLAKAANADAANSSTYYNWTRPTDSDSAQFEPNNAENCLTTLLVDDGFQNIQYGKAGTEFSWNNVLYNRSYSADDQYNVQGYFVEFGDQTTGDSGSGSAAYATADYMLNQPTGDIRLTALTWQGSGYTQYTCGVELPDTSKMVTIAVNSGYFTVPGLGGALTYLGGTNGTQYVPGYTSATTHYTSVVFSYTDVTAAETALGALLYAPAGTTPQTINATSSILSPQGRDMFFGGHFYRYVSGRISWPNAVLAAGNTSDPYFNGRGYIATATTQTENSILLRLTDTGGGGSDHWYDAWMGGLWQRNTGTLAAPVITRGTDGNELTYANLRDTTDIAALLKDYSLTTPGFDANNSSNFICNNPNMIRYYWIDGPEAGEELPNNTADFAPWHATGATQDEPNTGDFIYIGWEGAYWDDMSAYSNDNIENGYERRDGYILEFSGFDGGSAAGIVSEDSKTVSVSTATVYTKTDGNAVNVTGSVALWQNGSAAATCVNDGIGIYSAMVLPGTYDVFIDGVDTGINLVIDGASGSATVHYYTIAFAVADAGTASGSTIAVTAAGENFVSGATALAGSPVVMVATGAGAAGYTYVWTGDGSNGETANTLWIPALNAPIEVLCTVTGVLEIPQVTTNPASGITENSAVLSGNVTFPRGTRTRLECGFVYAATSGPALNGADAHQVSANDLNDGTFSAAVAGLKPGMTYFVRAYARDSRSTTYGGEIRFTTLGGAVTDVPRTGDDSNTLLWWLLGGLSAAGMAGCILLGKRRPVSR